MSLFSTTIPNLVSGVSQQPYALRLASQAELQVNGFSSVVEGLKKRPPTKHSARFLTSPLTNAYLHLINRDASERYVVTIVAGDLRVFRLDGTEVSVAFPDGKGYLNSASPADGFAAVTIADYTFILNKAIATASDATKTSGTRPYEALIWVRQGAYKTKYTATVGTATASFTTPDASLQANAEYITTEYICTKLFELLTTGITTVAGAGAAQSFSGTPITTGYTVENLGSSLYISNASDFTCSVKDGQADQALKLMKGTVQRFTDLPARAKNGVKFRVRGSSDSDTDDYWVVYEADATNPYGGVWRETAKPGEIVGLDASKMPHVLVRESGGTFTFKRATWDDRKVGDTTTIPFPSFVGRKINDIFFHRDRLGLLADENVIMSRAGGFFNFFRQSAIQLLDTDLIDIAASHVKVSILRHAIPFNETLLLFSDQTQFQLGRAELLTPKTAALNQTTEFECSLRAKPVGAGRNVYFAIPRGQFTGIREYFASKDVETNDAAEVTAHCPKYITGNVFKIATTSNEDFVAVLSANSPNKVFTYRYYWGGDEKLQSAWSEWEFPAGDTVLNVDFIESSVWLVVSRSDGTYIESMDIEPGRTDTGGTFVVHLDRRVDETGVGSRTYNAGTNQTTFIVPYLLVDATQFQLYAWHGDATFKPGQQLQFTHSVVGSTTLITVTGNLTKFFFGRRYVFRYRFSPLVMREQAKGGGEQAITGGRLQVRYMNVAYSHTGYFRAEVTPVGRDTYSYVFSGRVVGSVLSQIGKPGIQEGSFKFPVQSQNTGVTIDLVNDSPFPCAFLSAEWEGFFHIRSRRA